MKLRTLLSNTRVFIRDIKYNSNSDRSDTLFSDEELITFYNDALYDFDYQTHYNEKGYDIHLYINTKKDKDVYDLPIGVLQVKSLTYDKYPLCQSNYYNEEYPAFTHNINGIPLSYQVNYSTNTIRFSPMIVKDGLVKMRAVVETPVFTLQNLDDEIPLPQKYHESFKYFIAGKCLESADQDAEDINRSVYYFGQWNNFCRKVSIEIIRREYNHITVSNGIYNV